MATVPTHTSYLIPYHQTRGVCCFNGAMNRSLFVQVLSAHLEEWANEPVLLHSRADPMTVFAVPETHRRKSFDDKHSSNWPLHFKSKDFTAPLAVLYL